MRCFIAIEIPTNLKGKILELQKALRVKGRIKWVEPQNLHLTLKFLGEISEIKVKEVGRILEEIKSKKFEVELKGLGVFPNFDYIRVIWVGVESFELIELQQKIDSKLSKLGFKKEKDFLPHLTLGRVKSLEEKSKLKALIKANSSILIGKFEVEEIKLKQSILRREGPLYLDLKKIKLS